MKDLRILLVDDDEAFRNGMKVFLFAQGYEHVWTVPDGEKALETVRKETPDIVLVDLFLPGMNGLQVMDKIHQIRKEVPVLVLTCEADETYRQTAMSLGAFDYLTKPLPLTKLFSYLELRLKPTVAH